MYEAHPGVLALTLPLQAEGFWKQESWAISSFSCFHQCKDTRIPPTTTARVITTLYSCCLSSTVFLSVTWESCRRRGVNWRTHLSWWGQRIQCRPLHSQGPENRFPPLSVNMLLPEKSVMSTEGRVLLDITDNHCTTSSFQPNISFTQSKTQTREKGEWNRKSCTVACRSSPAQYAFTNRQLIQNSGFNLLTL